jgi:dephospho-CoA kinase
MSNCIGLSGGIASGKSTVSKMFADMGITIIDTDVIARELMNNEDIIKQITTHFGTVIFTENNIDRSKLRELIFNNSQAKRWLEELLHPKIRAIANEMCQSCNSSYCIIVIPLLYNKTQYDLARVCMTICDQETQIIRATMRDNISREQAIKIIQQQPSLAQKLRMADDIIDTNQDVQNVKQQVIKLHTSYSNLFLDKK